MNSSSYAEELPLPMNGNINPAGIAGSGESSDKRLNIYLSTQKGIHSNRHMAHRRRSLMDGTRDQTKLLGNPQFEALRRAHSAEGEPRESEVNLNSLHNTEPAKRTLARFAVLVTNAKTHLTAFSNTLLNTESSKSVSSEICKEFAQSANDHDTISVAGGLNTSPKKPEKADEENSMDFKSPIKRPTYFPSTHILMRLGSSRSKKSRTSSKRNKQRTEINAIDTPPSIGNQRILSCSSPDLNEWRINNTDRNSKPNDTISSELISPRVVSENNVYLNMKTGQDTRKMVRDSDKCGSLACLTTINEAATQLTANPASSIREFTDMQRKDPNDDHCAVLSYRNNLFSQKRSSFNENNIGRDQLRRLQSMMVDNQTKARVGVSRGRILINMQYFNPSSTFRVSLMKAVDIQASFKVSRSATIVAKVRLTPGTHKKKGKKKVVFSDNPDILEDFDFTDISFLELLDMHLKVSLYSKDGFFSRTKLIGVAYISMINYDVSVEKALWKTLRSLPEKVNLKNSTTKYSKYETCAKMHRPQGYKTFSCSTQLNTKFHLLINLNIPTDKEVSCFESLRCIILSCYV